MSGIIEVICGPMFAGKSEELIRKMKRNIIAKKNAIIFKPVIDDRYEKTKIVSHNGSSIDALPIAVNKAGVMSIMETVNIDGSFDVIGIDEAQFFDDSIIEVAEKLAKQGKHVFIAGLEKDFRGETFGPMGELLARADYVTKLDAICMKCGGLATMTQRIINGKVARYDDPVTLVGASDKYEARCRKCHEVLR